MPKANINSWSEYKDWIAGSIRNKKDFFYRGHSRDEWKLQSCFHRFAKKLKKPLSLEEYLGNVIPTLNYFVSAAHNEIINLNDQNEFGAFLSLTQHHGFPTPLLDWTYSPFIAAYFAFREVNDVNPGCDNVKIYIFDHFLWQSHFEQLYNLKETKQYVSVFIPFSKNNPRIISQRGTCTITNVDDMEQYINEREKEKSAQYLYTVLISVKDKPKIMKELNLMGINEMSLFPGIDGICRAMKDQFFSNDEIGTTPSEMMAQIKKYFENQKKKEESALSKVLAQGLSGASNVLGRTRSE